MDIPGHGHGLTPNRGGAVFRRDSSMPDAVSPGVRFGAYIESATPSGEHIDIVHTAEQEALYLFYVPSMRKKRPKETNILEDRGSSFRRGHFLIIRSLNFPTNVEEDWP